MYKVADGWSRRRIEQIDNWHIDKWNIWLKDRPRGGMYVKITLSNYEISFTVFWVDCPTHYIHFIIDVSIA